MNQLRVLSRRLLLAAAMIAPGVLLGGVVSETACARNHFSFSFGGFAPAPCYHAPVYAYPPPYYAPPVRVYYDYAPYGWHGHHYGPHCHGPRCW